MSDSKHPTINPDIIESINQPALVAWEIDPHKSYQRKHAMPVIIAACGLLPTFVMQGDDAPLRRQLLRLGFLPNLDGKGLSIDLDGEHLLRLDHTLTVGERACPLMQLKFKLEVCQLYPQSHLVIFTPNLPIFITKMR